ncbi:hypothetical protein L596_021828 [Steinernema carpocapsae]|uniref:Mitochondrial carrier protein n=1 Tax=Steinernema carpocapsae TaxID=34508 RepID=A0A4U5MJY9_STECR|nr:hypothetical protein L596_021828 [Steinernema carpocapsae]
MFYLPVYEKGKRELKKVFATEGSLLPTIIAGGVAGSLSWWTITPIEVVKNRIQTSSSHSPQAFLQTAKSIYKNEGLRAFGKGGLILIFRGFPVNAVGFVIYEKIMALGSAL